MCAGPAAFFAAWWPVVRRAGVATVAIASPSLPCQTTLPTVTVLDSPDRLVTLMRSPSWRSIPLIPHVPLRSLVQVVGVMRIVNLRLILWSLELFPDLM